MKEHEQMLHRVENCMFNKLDKAYKEGIAAKAKGVDYHDNPYKRLKTGSCGCSQHSSLSNQVAIFSLNNFSNWFIHWSVVWI